LTGGRPQAPREAGRLVSRMRRILRLALLIPALIATVTIALPLAFAQGIPNRQIPGILPVPAPAKALTPLPVPGIQYNCPRGYQKPDVLLRIPNLRICLPVGIAGFTPSGIAGIPAGGTVAATVSSQRAPPPPPLASTSATTVGGAIIACGGRTGFYACGRNAMECCAVTQDNPCFAGTHACKADASQGGANTACCF
jgi:hypothetical protein